jgi:1,4-dihydroxy-2-naphthoate octaprenyltransferase
MLIRYQPFWLDTVQYTTGISYYFYMVALAGWWNTPIFSPIGVLSAFYDGGPFGFTCAGLGEGFSEFSLASGGFSIKAKLESNFTT